MHRNKFKELNKAFLESHKMDTLLDFEDIVSLRRIKSIDKTLNMYKNKILKIKDDENPDNTYKMICKRFGLDYVFDIYSNIILTYKNDTREEITEKIRDMLRMHDDYELGEPIMILNNDYTLDIMNGDICIIVGATSESRTCYFPDYDKILELDDDYLYENTYYAYCLTFHKSQGSEWENVLIYLDYLSIEEEYETRYLNLNLIYTAINRAETFCYLYLLNDDYLDDYLESANLSDI